MTTKIVGLEELEDALIELRRELGGKEGNIVAQALRESAKPVFTDAKANLRSSRGRNKSEYKRTGRLLRAIKLRKHPNPRKLNEIYGVGVDPGKTRDDESGAWYGHFVEFGTVKQPAKNFLRQALENNRTRSPAIFGASAGRKIEAAAKKIGNKNAQKVGAKAKAVNTRALNQ